MRQRNRSRVVVLLGSAALALAWTGACVIINQDDEGRDANLDTPAEAGTDADADAAGDADAGGEADVVVDAGDVPACAPDRASCTAESCCAGLRCCSGEPIPPGSEYCSADSCPISDRNLKQDLRPVDVQGILARVLALPLAEWSYVWDGDGVRHLGPMAQDFRAAFGLGADDRHIFTLDAAGVSLAAVQALHQQVAALQSDNAALRAKLGAQDQALAAMGARVEALERRVPPAAR